MKEMSESVRWMAAGRVEKTPDPFLSIGSTISHRKVPQG